MRRTERLFQIVQILRRGRIVRAEEIAGELEVSVRTVYRDIAALKAERLPIDGEAGVGYRLGKGYELPPLMFTDDELEALLIGARIVKSWADPELGRAAGDVLVKIGAVLPADLRPRLEGLQLLAPPSEQLPPPKIDVGHLRRAMRESRKVWLRYADGAGAMSERIVWPMTMAFFPPAWVTLAWCELRQDFRGFRVDRIEAARFLDEAYPQMPGRRLIDFLASKKVRRNDVA